MRRRAVLAGMAAGVGLLPSRAADAGAAHQSLRVASDGTGITTIAAALDRAAALSGPVQIDVEPGTYREKLHVARPGVTLAGTGPGVVIVYGAAAGHRAPDGKPYGTGRTATLTVDTADVTLRDITIRNDFDYIADTVSHASGGAQAVALSIARTADRVAVERCAIEGYQDTLYVDARALFRRCRIVGGVDFIFGGAAAVFSGCEIVTRHVPKAIDNGFVAAPSTLASDRFGLVFDRCHLTREAGVPDGSTWLGRPWRAGGNMAILGAAAFLRCHLDAHIKAEGWTGMGFTDPAGVRRTLAPEDARLFELRSRGPGAGPAAPTRRRLTDAQAVGFTHDAILQGWAP
ncbi:pectinesterase family protein [Sphingomonas sp. PB2P19]|uniref:pectinesterase family protein n=1 Tax=Sphingomonas rhamnosi TaxID=3096156 RepID=UPI002FCC1CEA